MGRRTILDGTKIKYIQLPIMEKDLKKLGKGLIEPEFAKMITKLLHNVEKGKVPNQINLIDSIAEIENQNQPAK